MSREAIQEAEYQTRGPYHRRALAIPFRPTVMLYGIVLKMLPDLTNTRSLDYGGGDAALSTLIANKGADSFVFDSSSLALSFAQKADTRLHLIQGRTQLPFIDQSFDVVTMIETLEHLPDEDENIALAEIRRVLLPEGKLIVSVPSKKLPLHKKHYRHYDLSDLLEKLTQHDFQIDEVVSYRDITSFWKGKPAGKIVRASAYFIDWNVRHLTSSMGIMTCHSLEATGFIIQASTPSLLKYSDKSLASVQPSCAS